MMECSIFSRCQTKWQGCGKIHVLWFHMTLRGTFMPQILKRDILYPLKNLISVPH